jgi:hypothetical protein
MVQLLLLLRRRRLLDRHGQFHAVLLQRRFICLCLVHLLHLPLL